MIGNHTFSPTITRRRFASLAACALGLLVVRPGKALASMACPWRKGSRIDPLVVTGELTVHGSADMGEVVMRNGRLALKGGGRVCLNRLESR